MSLRWVKTLRGNWLALRDDGERVGEVNALPGGGWAWLAGNWWAGRGKASGRARSLGEARRKVEDACAVQLTLFDIFHAEV